MNHTSYTHKVCLSGTVISSQCYLGSVGKLKKNKNNINEKSELLGGDWIKDQESNFMLILPLDMTVKILCP